jgi:hypothetical protein
VHVCIVLIKEVLLGYLALSVGVAGSDRQAMGGSGMGGMVGKLQPPACRTGEHS